MGGAYWTPKERQLQSQRGVAMEKVSPPSFRQWGGGVGWGGGHGERLSPDDQSGRAGARRFLRYPDLRPPKASYQKESAP